jgi:hypothetical protein
MRVLIVGELSRTTWLVISLVTGLLDFDDIRTPISKLANGGWP